VERDVRSPGLGLATAWSSWSPSTTRRRC
jgi:hypothetical protein